MSKPSKPTKPIDPAASAEQRKADYAALETAGAPSEGATIMENLMSPKPRTDGTEAPPVSLDPFAPENSLINPSLIQAKKEQLVYQCRKPLPDEWVTLCPRPEYVPAPSVSPSSAAKHTSPLPAWPSFCWARERV